jgi:hypothetical protein
MSTRRHSTFERPTSLTLVYLGFWVPHTPNLRVGVLVMNDHDRRPKISTALACKLYFANTFSKKSNARASSDCPSQNIACFRTAGLRFVCAT